ncbi:conserved hypothetical protein [Lodderomyces elongisporus NRRL YB-4239]|uniref:Probable cytosolic iron-sulfur protein assembly protein 1 n=1 Tax=Lodderomyces elongisporus (strain ATCC 11503 / CBS 2605 / JCM 1781 / NBRC 1676 / NRRL YB-4239) TaxID=379508 RepID=CIAO1_LODEL|nr:RecName: Full=Probable cytosolic iron-sulfur protein assembly protein 1 [Lodderomyces elongisporus NRRL YB-4239]EDK45724.1 conserved hypothetical protein [Lodderomyces elongisporus NRRL YB-4239]
MKLLHSIKAHDDKVWSLSSHPTLPLLATASTDKCSNIYRLSCSNASSSSSSSSPPSPPSPPSSSSPRRNFPQIAHLEDTHRRSVRSVSFKPPMGGIDHQDSNILDLPALASGSFDSTISIWGIDEPDDDNTYEIEEIIANQKEFLASPGNEWNLMAVIEGHENEIKAVDWNFSGRYLASCSRDKTVWIWETDPETLEEFECVAVLTDHTQDVKHVTWHPTRNLLASSSYDDTIRVYKQEFDDDEWSCVGMIDGHEGTVWCSKFESPKSPKAKDGTTRLVSVSDDLSARVWASKDNTGFNGGSEQLQSQSQTHLPSSIRHNAEEMVWEQESTLPQIHTHAIYSVAWSSSSGKIATAGSDGRIVVYKETNAGWEVENIQESAHGVYEINCVIWAKLDLDQEVLISGGDDGNVNIWEV